MDELRVRLVRVLYESTWDEEFALAAEIKRAFTGQQVDAVLAEVEEAGYVLVERERLERIGLVLWSLIEEEDYRDEMLGLQPGDRAAIPGALTGKVGE